MIYTVALSFNLVLSIVISFVVFIFSRNLLEAMQVPAAMLDESDMYMRIVGGTIFTQALINAFNSASACGNSRTRRTESENLKRSVEQKSISADIDNVHSKTDNHTENGFAVACKN